MFDSIFKGKKIFLTGHTGFKGSWFLCLLNLLEADIKGYALAPNTNPSLFNDINGEGLCDSVIEDIRNLPILKEELVNYQPDFVFHFAAQPLVRDSYEDPIETISTNVMGTSNLLEACRSIDKKVVIIVITTDKVYQNKEWEYPYRENDRLGGYDPYSMSKAACELVVDSFTNSFFNPESYVDHKTLISSARAGNVIGGGDWSKDRIIPDMIRAIQRNEDLVIRNPNSVRPWQHVIEPLVGYLELANQMWRIDSPTLNGAWNFGPSFNERLTVRDLVHIGKDFFPDLKIHIDKKVHPHEAKLLRLDISKANSVLKWKPFLSAKDAIYNTMEWYQKVLNGFDPKDLINDQIKVYLRVTKK